MREPTIELKAELIKSLRSDIASYNISRLLKGYDGECTFDQLYCQFAGGGWQYIKDFSFDTGTLTQIDAIVVMPNHIFVYEIKNYDAHCEVKDDIFLYNGQEVASNPFTQLQTIKSRFNSLLRRMGYKGEVSYYLVMVNENCYFENRSDYSNLIMRNEIKRHFSSFESHKQHNLNYNPKFLATQFKTFEIINLHNQNYVMDFTELTPGILCYECGSVDTYASHKQIKCSNCFNGISKIQALRQQIGELSVMNNQRNITNSDIYLFSNKLLSRKFISNRLSTILNRVAGRAHQYESDMSLFNFDQALTLYRNKEKYRYKL